VLTLSRLAQNGRLPLHLAAIYGAGLDVVEALLEVYPEAAKVADKVRWIAVWGILVCGYVYMYVMERVAAAI